MLFVLEGKAFKIPHKAVLSASVPPLVKIISCSFAQLIAQPDVEP